MDYKPIDYYEALAEHIKFRGITPFGLLQIAQYKPGKCWSDLERAVTSDVGGGSFTCESQFAILAKRISEVVDINTFQPLWEYERRLRNLPVPAHEPAHSN